MFLTSMFIFAEKFDTIFAQFVKGRFIMTIGEKIKSLRKAKNLKQGDLARKLKMTSAQLCRIECAKNEPSVKTLSRIAKALSIPLSELVAEKPAATPSPDPCSSDDERLYPTQQSHAADSSTPLIPVRTTIEPSETMESILRLVTKRNSEYDHLEESLGISPATTLPLCHACSIDDRGAEMLAHTVRTSCNVGDTPITDIVGLLESKMVRVIPIKIPFEVESRSFFQSETRTLVIAVNNRLTPERQAYRIAYELGYACLFGSSGFTTVDMRLELNKFVRRFAAAFLMPEDSLRSLAARLALGPGNWTFNLLLNLKAQYGVAAEKFTHRLEKTGLISSPLRKKFREEISRYREEHDNAEPPPSLKPLTFGAWLSLLKLRASQ